MSDDLNMTDVSAPGGSAAAAAVPAAAAASAAESAFATAATAEAMEDDGVAIISHVQPVPTGAAPLVPMLASARANLHAPAGWLLPQFELIQPVQCAATVAATRDKQVPPKKLKGRRNSSSSSASDMTEAAAEASEAAEAVQRVNRWLLLAAYGALKRLDLSRTQEAQVKLPVESPTYTLAALLDALHAQADYRDARGFTAVHWLVFDALEKPQGEARYSTGSTGELQIDASGCCRWGAIEARLDVLLRASEKAGYSYKCRDDSPDDVAQVEQGNSRNLLDVQDKDGNTPLVRSRTESAV